MLPLFQRTVSSQKLLLKPRGTVRVGAFDIYMAKLVFEPQIVIRNRDSAILFDAFVTLDPLVQKRGVYSFYGLFQGPVVGGGVYFQPEKNTLMVSRILVPVQLLLGRGEIC